jgi:hypothetical protein
MKATHAHVLSPGECLEAVQGKQALVARVISELLEVLFAVWDLDCGKQLQFRAA